ncbi:MAG: hypothetical protein IT531_17470 [Burkholderiales bacterium]|nr:hypothetical protein [Burkholderiales bacterium]
MSAKSVITESRVAPPVAGFPVAVRAGALLFVSGRVGLDASTGFPLSGYAALGRKPVPALGLLAPDSWEEAFVAQAVRIYEDLAILLAEQGAAPADLLFYSIYMRRMRDFPVLARARAALFAGGVAPPSTASQVPGLLYPDALVYFDPVALVPAPNVKKEVLSSRHVVQGPLSNYELASRCADFTFYAGVVGAHPQNGLIVYGPDQLDDPRWLRPGGSLAERMLLEPLSAQTYTIYRLLHDMLAEHGTDARQVLRHNVYLRAMSALPELERQGRSFYPQHAPPATLIGVDSLARRDFLLEIEAITYCGGALETAAPSPRVARLGYGAAARRGGELIVTSALVGYDGARARMLARIEDLPPEQARAVCAALSGLTLERASQCAAAAQTREILNQLDALLGSLGSALRKLVKITLYVREMQDFPFVQRVLLSALGDDPPAISVVAVADLPLRAARVQLEAMALA